MLVLTTDVLPAHIKLKEVHGLLETTYPIEISSKNFMRNVFERKRNEHQEAYEAFVKSAGDLGNVIYGVRITTSAANAADGIFLLMTYCGTLATCEIGQPSDHGNVR